MRLRSEVGLFQVRGCRISTGDDNIVIKEGSRNILIDLCWLLDGHGTSLGSLGEANSFGSIENVVVRNIVYNRTDFGARIKTWQVTAQHHNPGRHIIPILCSSLCCKSFCVSSS
jgi:polygalacturonase